MRMRRSSIDSQRHSYEKDSVRQSCVQPQTALSLLRIRRAGPAYPSLLIAKEHHAQPWTRLALGINQLSGPAGCAKTQIALSICIQAATTATVAESGIKAVFLSLGSSRHSMLAQRLEQMATNLHKHKPTENNPLQRILLKAVMTPEDLQSLVCPKSGELIRILQANPSIQVLILDDIATMFRVLEGSFMARSAALFRLAASLKQLGEIYELPVLVLNQVTSRFTVTMSQTNNSNNDTNSSSDEPALGLSWSQCVNQSYSVSRKGSVRVLTLDRSPSFGIQATEFEVQDGGVVLV
jgi:hypothetical protein